MHHAKAMAAAAAAAPGRNRGSDEMQDVMITGRCLCGAVRFHATEPPLASRACWCRLCQYLGAGSGTVNVCFRRESFVIDGELKDFASTADSGNRMHRRFCGTCGTPLFSEAESRPHLIFVRAGALDDRALAAPTATIWTAEAPAWGCINADLPQLPGQAPPVA
jgi:hypothetical protein